MNANATAHSFRSIVVLTLLAALTLVVLPPSPLSPSTPVAEAATAPVNPLDLDPLSVTLTSSAPDFPAGGSVTLTATSTVPVEQIGGTIEIVAVATGGVVKTCSSGTSCTFNVAFTTGVAREYVARVGNETSAPVTVARKAWTVQLTSTRDTFTAGQSFTLKAVTNQSTGATSGAYAVYIVDLATGSPVKMCTTNVTDLGGGAGFSCDLSTTYYSGDARQYVAYVASVNGAAVDVQATSSSATVTRAPWTVSLASSTGSFAAGSGFWLTATVNQNPSSTNGTYAVHIVDTTTGAVIKTCASNLSNLGADLGLECAVSARFYTGGAHTYTAVVARAADATIDVQAQSAPVSVARQQWVVSLTPSTTSFAAGSVFNLTATTNQNLSATAGNYALHIVDLTTGDVVKTCTAPGYNGYTGYDCNVQQRFYSGPPHTYGAYVAATGSWQVDQQAQSAPATVARKTWSITMSASATAFEAGSSVALSAESNQYVGSTGVESRIVV